MLIVSAHDQVNDVLDALEAGAAGYALKCDGPEALIEAIRVVSRGERYMAPALRRGLAAFEGAPAARATCWASCPRASARSSAWRPSA